MSDLSEEVLRALADKSKITVLTGQFVEASSSGYTVDVGGGRIPAALGTSYLPEVNESVWVWFIDGKPFVIGPTLAKPDRGTVVDVNSGLVQLTTDLGTVLTPYGGAAPTAGDVMKLTWHGGPYAMSVMSVSPPPNVAPPASVGGAKVHTDEFAAIDAGSFISGRWWTDMVYADASNLGAWFYGTKIADTVPSDAVIQRVDIFISEQTISGTPNFALHSHLTKPAGAPSLSSSTAVAIAHGWVQLPTSFGNALRAGGGQRGVGLNHGGNSILHSRAQDGQSGSLRITSTY